MDALSQDLRVALRRLQRAPALATAIVLTIGLGLGAAAAIFTTSDAALVEPLPYADPQRLVHLWEVRAGTAERSPTSYPTLLDWRSRAKSFSALEAYDPTNSTVGMGDEARMLRGAQVTAGFFRLLGVRISAGRDFLDEDATTGAGVAIVSERFARSVAGGIALTSWECCPIRVTSRCFRMRTSLCHSSPGSQRAETGRSARFTSSGGFGTGCR